VASSLYTGAWLRKALSQTGEPLLNQRDPAHETPDDGGPDPYYVDGSHAPAMPVELTDGQILQPNVPARYVDQTPYGDPNHGLGDQPGIDYDVARDLGNAMREIDEGSVSARGYAPMIGSEGIYQVTVVRNDVQDGGDSPETVAIRYEQGVGTASDFAARVNTRIQRWRDRPIDFHRYDVVPRPLLVKQAEPPQNLPAYTDGAPWATPYPTNGEGTDHPDNWQIPQDRRTPRQFNESATIDGTEDTGSTGYASADFGLTTWGL
jgi:hypothetical protein